jgi:ATP phosphoribosyltransferase
MPKKGRLSEDTLTLFADAGLAPESRADRALSATLGDEFEAIFVRAQDIPEFVADGAADAGVTGWDLICESARPLTSALDLGFGACRMVVAARTESEIKSVNDIDDGARVATSFPRVTAEYFNKAGRSIEVGPISGATESAPRLGIADIIVDLTSTGSSLRSNGLREIATVLTSSARLVTRDDSNDTARAKTLCDLRLALESVLRARGMRYLMANVPRDQLERVKEIVPGLNGPTISTILNGGNMAAVHAVVPAARVYRTIAELKSLGGEGILVTRIERLMS